MIYDGFANCMSFKSMGIEVFVCFGWTGDSVDGDGVPMEKT